MLLSRSTSTGWASGPGVFVVVLDAETQCLVADGGLLGIPEVEAFFRIRQEDYRKFEALALVDGHDVDSIGHGIGGDGFEFPVFFVKFGQVVQEGIETAAGGAVPGEGELVEGKYVIYPPLAAGKAGEPGEVFGVRENSPKEGGRAVLHGFFPPCFEERKEMAELLFFFFRKYTGKGENGPEVGLFFLFLPEVEESEVLLIEAHKEGTEYGCRCQVLERVVQKFQQGPENFHIPVLHEVLFLVGNGRDAVFFQYLHEDRPFSCNGTEENHHVSVPGGSEGTAFPSSFHGP